jgi:adenosylcobinamide hydrolase
VHPSLHLRREDGEDLPFLVWPLDHPHLAISSGPVGGGIGRRHWVLNATVAYGYDRMDPDRHLADLAGSVGLDPQDGIGLLTAVDVRHRQLVTDHGVEVTATTGISEPQWAAVPVGDPSLHGPEQVGTINVVAFVPVRLSPAALVNAVATIAEAKAQAFRDLGLAGTGTPTDAVVVLCPADGPEEPFGGPRSVWGSRLARAAHRAVRDGAVLQAEWKTLHPIVAEAPIPAPGPPLRLDLADPELGHGDLPSRDQEPSS